MSNDFIQKFQNSPHGMVYVAPTGSGKTRIALEATKDQDTTVVGTASLTKNFAQEEMKAFGKITPRHVSTYSALARTHELPGGRNLVLDEAHYIRNPQTKGFKKIMTERGKYDKALLMTATPIINEPYDIASQVNLVAGDQVVPTNKKTFYEKFYGEKKIDPGIIARMQGVEPGSVRFLKNPKQVQKSIGPYVHVEDSEKYKALLPKRTDEIVSVPMGEQQQNIYKYIEHKLPYSIAYKVKQNLPPSKQEAKGLNFYLGGLRQVSNTTTGYSTAVHENPKIQKILTDLKEEVGKGGKTIVYSNYLDSGVQEIKKSLQEQKIPYGQIIGSMSKSERERQVNDYNSDKVKTMLITGAGSEGINLPRTSLVQLAEPHWNIARLYQASSRGIRRGDDPNREVKVKTYLSTFPEKDRKFLGINLGKKKPQQSVDQYLYNMSKTKEHEADTFLSALREKQAAKISLKPLKDVYRTTGSVTSLYDPPIKVNIHDLQKLEQLKLKSNKEKIDSSDAWVQDFKISREHYENELKRIFATKRPASITTSNKGEMPYIESSIPINSLSYGERIFETPGFGEIPLSRKQDINKLMRAFRKNKGK